jgi:hypothetical protein
MFLVFEGLARSLADCGFVLELAGVFRIAA